MSQSPTIGRTVLFVLPSSSKRAGEIRPATVVRVNSTDPTYGSVNLRLQLDGPNDAGEPDWQGSVKQDQDGKAPGSWHWMQVQQAGGGFEARISALEKANELRAMLSGTESVQPFAHQPSIFEDKPRAPKVQDDRESHAGYVAKAVQQLEATLAQQLIDAVQNATSPLLDALASAGERLAKAEAGLHALNAAQPKRQQVAEISDAMSAVGCTFAPAPAVHEVATPACPVVEGDPNGAH